MSRTPDPDVPVVSGRVLEVLLRAAAESGLDRGRLTAGLPLSSPSGRVLPRLRWADFVAVLERAHAAVGDRETLETVFLPATRLFTTLFGLISLSVDIRDYYRLINRGLGPNFFPHLPNEYDEYDDGRICFSITIPEPYVACETFLHIVASQARNDPTLLGFDAPVIERTVTPRHGRYIVTPAPRRALAARARKLVARVVPLALIREFDERNEELRYFFRPAEGDEGRQGEGRDGPGAADGERPRDLGALADGARPADLDARVARARLAWGLTKRQADALAGVARGQTNKEIAAAWGRSEAVVEVHVSAALKKAGVPNRAALVATLYANV